jgi:hypothetical protein
MKTDFVDNAPAGADPSYPTFAQFQDFAERSGVGILIQTAERRSIAGRSALVTRISIRRPAGAWRETAPIVQGLVGPAVRALATVLEPTLAWLRFCDLASLPRPSDASEGWDTISTRAVADHVSFMLGVLLPDIDALETNLAIWRRSTLDEFARGLSPPAQSSPNRVNRDPSAKARRRCA